MFKLSIRHTRGVDLVHDDELQAMIASQNPNKSGFAKFLQAKTRMFDDAAKILYRPLRIQNMHYFNEWALATSSNKTIVENNIYVSMYSPNVDPELTGAAVTLMAIMLTLTGQSKMRTTPDLEMRDKIRKFLSVPIQGGGAMDKISDAFNRFKNMLTSAFNALGLVRLVGEYFISILNSFLGFIAQLAENAESNNCVLDTIAMICSFSLALDVAKPFIGAGLPSIASILTTSGIVFGRQGSQALSIIFHALTIVMWGAGNLVLGMPTSMPFLAMFCIYKLLFGDFTWEHVWEYFKRKGDEFKEAVINWLKQSFDVLVAVKNKLINIIKRPFSNKISPQSGVGESKADDSENDELSNFVQKYKKLLDELNLDGCRNPTITRPIREILKEMRDLHFELKDDYEKRGKEIEELDKIKRRLLERIKTMKNNHKEALELLELRWQTKYEELKADYEQRIAKEIADKNALEVDYEDIIAERRAEQMLALANLNTKFEDEKKELEAQYVRSMESFEASAQKKFDEEHAKREALTMENKATRLSRDSSLLLVFAIRTWTTRILFATSHFSIHENSDFVDFIKNLEKQNGEVFDTLIKLIKTTDDDKFTNEVVPHLDALLMTFPEWIEYRNTRFPHVLTLDEVKIESIEKEKGVAQMITGSLLSVAPVIIPTIMKYHDPVPLVETTLSVALGTALGSVGSAAQLAWLTQNVATTTAGICAIINGYKKFQEIKLAARVRTLTEQDYSVNPLAPQRLLEDETHRSLPATPRAGAGDEFEGGEAFSNDIFEIMYNKLIENIKDNSMVLELVKNLEREVDDAIGGTPQSLINLQIVEGKLLFEKDTRWLSRISSLFGKK
jgi:hypothetical protein